MVWLDGKINFSENFGWQVEDVQMFDEPIEAKGHLSFGNIILMAKESNILIV